MLFSKGFVGDGADQRVGRALAEVVVVGSVAVASVARVAVA